MNTLFENVFRKQLRRIIHDIGLLPNVDITFSYTDTNFVYEISILAGGKRVLRVMDHISEDGIKEMVDCLIREHREDTLTVSDNDISGRDRYERTNYINIEPFVSHWDGEIRDSGPTLLDGLREVCNG